MARSISCPLPTYDWAGFDAKYAPAYYEETDLAFKVRRDGYKVLYQPFFKCRYN
jgi:GT2 family glycosyltransferase